MTQSDLSVLSSTQVIVGLSAIVKVVPTAYQFAESFKYASGGSLEIVPPGTGGWGTGYLMSTSEIVAVDGPAVFYLAATGATAIVHMIIGRTAGATVI